ncbi:type II toxin-antitoxin system HipA family toxin [Dyella koreensis]|uniref:Type II toxin-antitoxin system HipA family toxin n=1 Tax=Dyella koreensis TaxID=311235 RepID=A0ABW8KAV1_9GAMM
MTDTLHVRLFDRHVGTLTMTGEVRAPEDWLFTYDADYLHSLQPVALSVSLPLRTEPFAGATARNWFGNLLPEGPVREAIASRLRIPVWDDFALLAAIGGECAGAVSIVPPRVETTPHDDSVLDLEALLAAQGDDTGEASLALIGTPRRLSLAGAQDKIAVVLGADGAIRLPGIGEITTHILKPDSLRIRGLRDFEAFGLALARSVGLVVASSSIVTVAGHKALLIERYDRHVDEHGQRMRLHQEDFCQALGYPGEHKYEANGGPTLTMCAQLLRQQLRLGPAALQTFLDWVTFNAVIGNADAHAKNLALLCAPNGTRRLAPFYDLVPTIAISERMVDRKPALSIGHAARIDEISVDDWQQFAEATGYASRFVKHRVIELAAGVGRSLIDVGHALVKQGAEPARIEKAQAAVARNTHHLLTLFGA